MNRSGIEQQAGNDDAVRIRSRHGSRAMDGTQRGKTESQHHSVGAGDTDRRVEVIYTGRKEQILAVSKLSIDTVRCVDACPGDIEPADRVWFYQVFRHPSR